MKLKKKEIQQILLKRIICNLAHIPVFVLLTFFWLKALEPGKKKRHTKKYIALILACLLLFAVSDEFHQYFVLGRSATIMDLGLDLLGILFGLSVYLVLERKTEIAIFPVD
ncbi:MAG: VanZ family protein [Deltaproteobacteria bacterium]|nr:VanZ family protein [Deltaproteobacteria bacterium]